MHHATIVATLTEVCVIDPEGVLIFSEEGNRGGLQRGSDHCRSDTLKDCLTQSLLDDPGC